MELVVLLGAVIIVTVVQPGPALGVPPLTEQKPVLGSHDVSRYVKIQALMAVQQVMALHSSLSREILQLRTLEIGGGPRTSPPKKLLKLRVFLDNDERQQRLDVMGMNQQ